jgi:hypothetical protein
VEDHQQRGHDEGARRRTDGGSAPQPGGLDGDLGLRELDLLANEELHLLGDVRERVADGVRRAGGLAVPGAGAVGVAGAVRRGLSHG